MNRKHIHTSLHYNRNHQKCKQINHTVQTKRTKHTNQQRKQKQYLPKSSLKEHQFDEIQKIHNNPLPDLLPRLYQIQTDSSHSSHSSFVSLISSKTLSETVVIKQYVKYVLQREIGFLKCFDKTHSKTYQRYLCTFGLGPCVSLAGYCKNNKLAFITHFDHMTSVHWSINMMSYQLGLKLKMQPSIDAKLVGGWKGISDELIKEIESALITHNDIPFDSLKKNLYNQSGTVTSTSVVIDVETGEFFDDIVKPRMSSEEEMRFKRFISETDFYSMSYSPIKKINLRNID